MTTLLNGFKKSWKFIFQPLHPIVGFLTILIIFAPIGIIAISDFDAFLAVVDAFGKNATLIGMATVATLFSILGIIVFYPTKPKSSATDNSENQTPTVPPTNNALIKTKEELIKPKLEFDTSGNHSFVSGYQHDIFVSYASVDNQDGWVTTLIDWLQGRLGQKLGKNAFSLWMDHELRDNTSITSDTTKRLEKSATLLLILSKGYLESQWCQSELNTFLAKVNKDHVFLVKCGDMQIPEKLIDSNSYRFWGRDKTDNPCIFNSDSQKYVAKVTILCEQLKEKMEALKKQADKFVLDKLSQEQQAKSKKTFKEIQILRSKAFVYKEKGDSEAFLWMARKTAEAICCKIFTQKIGAYPKKQDFNKCIGKLENESSIPKKYIRYLKNIQEAGNEAVHYQCEDEYTQMATENFPDCDFALKRLTDWYINEYFSQAADTPTVFLAKVTEDLEEHRDKLKSYLEQYQVKILPDKDHPIAEYQFRQFLEQELPKCDLFIQLLSDNSGYQDFSYPQIQYEHAKLVYLPILQWRDHALNLDEVSNIAYRQLLEADTVVATTVFFEFQEIVNTELKNIQFSKINKE